MQLHRNDADSTSAVCSAASYQPLSEAEIYAIKKQYLGLLPPQQVIDVCLTFEAHAPLHVKSSVWPYDIRAAISSIQAQNSTPTSAQGAPSVAQPAASQSQPAPGTPYPHQSYYHPTYPHTPYYTSHGTYGYPHPYPSYPQTPGGYHPPAPHPPLFTNTPLVHPPHPPSDALPPLSNVDDLPSYEEMIVEALLDSGDPEGCAPKSLFSWMAMHYPLQMNFRPSASQALQKAYKRGRLEKGSNGKYRLNENWEGGNTSRRTTRRPQTLAQSALPGPQPPSSTPFTHGPLVPHGATSLPARLPPPGQPPGYAGYPFGFPYPGTAGSALPSVPRDGAKAASQKQTMDAIDHETGEGSDAWEAAQNILKAINFGQLFKISSEDCRAGEPSASSSSSNHQVPASGSDDPSLASGVMGVEESTGGHPGGFGKSTELNAEQRAALQAQLALLAAQLAELAEVTEDELSHKLEVSQSTATVPDSHAPQVLGEGSVPDVCDSDGEVDENDNEDMVEVPVSS